MLLKPRLLITKPNKPNHKNKLLEIKKLKSNILINNRGGKEEEKMIPIAEYIDQLILDIDQEIKDSKVEGILSSIIVFVPILLLLFGYLYL